MRFNHPLGINLINENLTHKSTANIANTANGFIKIAIIIDVFSVIEGSKNGT
jgi:hypothetical protein